MIQIKPSIKHYFTCPFCSKKVASNEVIFWGLVIVAKFECQSYSKSAYISLNIGHFTHFPCVFQDSSSLSTSRKQNNTALWLHQPLLNSFYQKNYTIPTFRKVVYHTKSKAILLNCLDPVYGHALWRLLNYAKLYKKYPEYAIILLIPKNFEYLFPNSRISELWILDNNLEDFQYLMPNLNRIIQQEIRRFEEFHLAKAEVQPQVSQETIENLFSQKTFTLPQFTELSPKVLLVMRNDRFWLSKKWEYLLFRIYKRFNLQLLTSFFIQRQHKHFNKLAKHLRQKNSTLHITAIGFGNPKGLSKDIQDLRSPAPDSDTENYWNQLASKTHLVVGVHGSHLLIPTALSMAFIELLPLHRIENFGEASIFTQKNPRYSNFLKRILPLATSPKIVTRHILHILEGFQFLRKTE